MTKYHQIWKRCVDYGGQNMGGWLTQKDREWLAEWLTSLKFDYSPMVAEIGVFQGGGSLIFLTALPTCRFFAIDNFSEGPPSPPYKSTKDAFLVYTKPFENRIKIFEGDSVEIGQIWRLPLDICFVDGCHYGYYPEEDISNFMPWIKPKGYMLIDDYNMKQVKKAVSRTLFADSNWTLIHNPEFLGGDIIAFRKEK